MNAQNRQQPSRRKSISTFFMVSAGILLLVDLLIWAGTLSSAIPGFGSSPVVSIAISLVFLFGLPLAFIGPLLFFIGLLIRLTAKQHPGVVVLFSGIITFVIGILAFVIPQLLVAPGSGDTLMAWMAGLTALLVGVPLIFIGGVLFLVGIVLVLKQSLTARQRAQA